MQWVCGTDKASKSSRCTFQPIYLVSEVPSSGSVGSAAQRALPRLGNEDPSALRRTDPRFSTKLQKSYKSSLKFGVRCEILDSRTCRAAASVVSTFIFTHKKRKNQRSAHGPSFRIKKKIDQDLSFEKRLRQMIV